MGEEFGKEWMLVHVCLSSFVVHLNQWHGLLAILQYKVDACSVMSDSFQAFGLKTARLFCLWDFSGENTGVGCHFFLQGIFPTQGLNPSLLCFLHCWQILYPLSYWGSLSVQFSSVAQSCLTLWDPMHRSTPGLPVHHQLPEFTQTHVHRVSDAIQPSHPLLSPSPPIFNLSQHQGLFEWVSSSHRWPKYWEAHTPIQSKKSKEKRWNWLCS